MPKSVLRAVLGRMQPFTLYATRQTPHGAPRLVQAMPDRGKPDVLLPDIDCRDARVYGHTTTAMHKLSTALTWAARPPPAKKKGHMYRRTCHSLQARKRCCYDRRVCYDRRGTNFFLRFLGLGKPKTCPSQRIIWRIIKLL